MDVAKACGQVIRSITFIFNSEDDIIKYYFLLNIEFFDTLQCVLTLLITMDFKSERVICTKKVRSHDLITCIENRVKHFMWISFI